MPISTREPRRRRRQPLRARARRRPDPARARPSHALRATCANGLHAAKRRDRDRRGRRARGAARRAAHVVPRRDDARADAHHRLRGVEPPRQPGAALHRRRARPRELSRSVRAPAPRSTSRCCATATTSTSGSTSTRPRSPTSTRSCPTSRDVVRRRSASASGRDARGRAQRRTRGPGAIDRRRATRRSADRASGGARSRSRGRRRRGAASALRRRARSRSPDRGCGVRRVEQIDERDGREHPGAALGARRNRRRVEPAGEREQAVGFARVELDLLPVLVDDPSAPATRWRVACRSLGPAPAAR